MIDEEESAALSRALPDPVAERAAEQLDRVPGDQSQERPRARLRPREPVVPEMRRGRNSRCASVQQRTIGIREGAASGARQRETIDRLTKLVRLLQRALRHPGARDREPRRNEPSRKIRGLGEQLPWFGSKSSRKGSSEVERNAAAPKLESIANFTPGFSHVTVIL